MYATTLTTNMSKTMVIRFSRKDKYSGNIFSARKGDSEEDIAYNALMSSDVNIKKLGLGTRSPIFVNDGEYKYCNVNLMGFDKKASGIDLDPAHLYTVSVSYTKSVSKDKAYINCYINSISFCKNANVERGEAIEL